MVLYNGTDSLETFDQREPSTYGVYSAARVENRAVFFTALPLHAPDPLHGFSTVSGAARSS